MLRIETYTGAHVAPHLDRVAALRIAVFRDWPYLYDGDAAYEATYLATYTRSARSLFVLVFDGDAVVGASTALPLADETDAFRAPFAAHGIGVDDVFYFGESVLLPAYRGRGLGHAFFDRREAHARACGGFRTTAFCAVQRDANDPRRPPGHRDNDAFWTKRGYARRDDLACELPWNEVERGEVPHRLAFWLRALEPA